MRYIEAHKRFKEGQQITHQIFLNFLKFDMFSNNNLVMKKKTYIYTSTLEFGYFATCISLYLYRAEIMAMIIQFT